MMILRGVKAEVLAFSPDSGRKGLFAGFYEFDESGKSRVPMLSLSETGLKYGNNWHFKYSVLEGVLKYDKAEADIDKPYLTKMFADQMPVPDYETSVLIEHSAGKSKLLILSKDMFRVLVPALSERVVIKPETIFENRDFECKSKVRLSAEIQNP